MYRTCVPGALGGYSGMSELQLPVNHHVCWEEVDLGPVFFTPEPSLQAFCGGFKFLCVATDECKQQEAPCAWFHRCRLLALAQQHHIWGWLPGVSDSYLSSGASEGHNILNIKEGKNTRYSNTHVTGMISRRG